MLFGSLDASNFITVDKPPASLWVMEISSRLFGFSSWSMLVPQALEGVATVGLVYATVRRRFSPAAALLSGLAMAVMPVAVLMFRFDNPDALLVLMVVAAYAVVRGLESAPTRAGTRWVVIAGVAIGFAFLTKSLQALLVLPALGVVWLLFADATWRRRLFQLGVGLLAMVVSAGWWLAVVSLWPASSRPYIGGSQDNSVWNLIFGYNGFGRLTGNETGSVGGGPGGTAGRWGATGITRLFGSEMGSQISWLLPAALLVTAAMLVLWRRRPRTDSGRAQVVLWALWLLVTGAVFSFAQGIIHPYYTVALAPAIAALCGIGGVELWRRRSSRRARMVLALAVAITAGWAFVLLDRSPAWNPWLRWVVLLTGLVATVGFVAAPWLRPSGRRVLPGVAALAAVTVFAAPAAYAAQTAATPHTGAIPSAGPQVTNTDFPSGQGTGGPGGFLGGPGMRTFPNHLPGTGLPRSIGGFPGLGGLSVRGLPGGGVPGSTLPGGALAGGGRFGFRPGGGSPFNGAPDAGGAAGGLLQAGTVSRQLANLIAADASSYRWVAAAVSAESASGFQLATGEPVMAIGGFNGTDPAPTLQQFRRYVAAGDIHYFVASGGHGAGGPMGGGPMGGGSPSSAANRITAWVEAHFASRTVDGVTLYDLTSPVPSSTTSGMTGNA